MLAECGWDDAEVDIASRLEACKRRWDLTGGSRLGGGFRCAVFACSADGGQVVVKLTPTPEEARLEAAALASCAHTGAAVRLIDADISANILGPGRADDLGGEASCVAGGVRVPAAQPGGGDQRRTRSRADWRRPARSGRGPAGSCPRSSCAQMRRPVSGAPWARRGFIHIEEPQMERS